MGMIVQKVGDKWRSLLTNLGEEDATIQGFLGDSQGSTKEACFKGLVYWLEGNADRPVTWETLLKALKESEFKGFADGLEKELTRYVLRHRLHIQWNLSKPNLGTHQNVRLERCSDCRGIQFGRKRSLSTIYMLSHIPLIIKGSLQQ